MPSASLAVAYRPSHAHPDKVRIAALSAAIALNVAALLLVLRPMAPQIATTLAIVDPFTVTWLTPKPKQPDPPPIELKKLPTPQPPAVPHAVPRSTPPPVVVPTDQGTIAAPPAIPTPTIQPVADTAAAPEAPLNEATLAYRASPLTFPATAIRRKMHGTVMLRVLVDTEGKPTQVTVEKSSGYELLDRSAREQVLANWRFQPATMQGHAVQAWARVPVSFELREL